MESVYSSRRARSASVSGRGTLLRRWASISMDIIAHALVAEVAGLDCAEISRNRSRALRSQEPFLRTTCVYVGRKHTKKRRRRGARARC